MHGLRDLPRESCERKKKKKRRKEERKKEKEDFFLVPCFLLYEKKTRGGKGEKKGDRKEIDANSGRGYIGMGYG